MNTTQRHKERKSSMKAKRNAEKRIKNKKSSVNVNFFFYLPCIVKNSYTLELEQKIITFNFTIIGTF